MPNFTSFIIAIVALALWLVLIARIVYHSTFDATSKQSTGYASLFYIIAMAVVVCSATSTEESPVMAAVRSFPFIFAIAVALNLYKRTRATNK